MYTIFIRTVVTYFFLLVAVRLMGKRQLGDLELSEFVITILLSELAVLPIANKKISLLHAYVPIVILITLEALISYISIKNRNIKKLVGGAPSVLINKGVICKSEMRKLRMSLDELLCQLRLKDIFDISEVEYAILEENGQMSVIPKMSARGVTLEDMNITKKEKGIRHTLIADGQISEFSLQLTGHSHSWLKKQLKKHKCRQNEVFLFAVDDSGEIIIVKNSDVE